MIRNLFISSVLLAASAAAAPLEKLSFAIRANGLYKPAGRFFIGADEEVRGNVFAVAAAFRGQTEFVGITPQKVTLNREVDQDNPLNGAAIDHLALLGRRPVVIPRNLPSSLFLIDSQRKPIVVTQSQPLNNAHGTTAPSVLSLTTTADDTRVALDAGADLAAIVAVPNDAGGFDGNGSGIAVVNYQQIVDKKKNTTFFAWNPINAKTGESSYSPDGTLSTDEGNKALAFGKGTPEVFLSESLSVLENAVDMHFDRDLGRLYIAVQAEAGSSANAGARAIVVASLANGRLAYMPIAPGTAFDGNNLIVGKREPQSATCIFKVRTMQTKNHLRYLIVVGGNGSDATLSQSVFALPLVDVKEGPRGMLADVTAAPQTLFQGRSFRARHYVKPAVEPDQLYTMDSLAAQVGAQGPLPGPITDIHISSEAVFVSCALDNELNQDQLVAGIFYSQPVFDTLGRISGWTNWQRVAAEEPILGFAHDAIAGLFWYIPQAIDVLGSNNDWADWRRVAARPNLSFAQEILDELFWYVPQGKSNEVFRSQWTDGTDELSKLISGEFSSNDGGVQGLFDFPYTTSSFTSNVQNRLAVQLFTGYKKVLFLQTGKQVDGLFSPSMDLENKFTSTDGSLTGFTETSVIVTSGGALDILGPIIAATVISDGINGWFVVAGSGGLAVLAADGQGWNAQQGLGSGFKGLSGEWHIISSTRDIRKLIAQDGQLFVLSNDKLERLALSQESIAQGTVPSVTLLELSEKQQCNAQSYSDLYIKGPLALVATSTGLLRSGDGTDIRTATTQKEANWTPFDLPESVGSLTSPGPVTRLFAITPENANFDDNVYLLNAYVGLNQALVYRLVITLDGGRVTDDSVQLFPDFIVRGINSFFTNLGEYRNYIVTDGSLISVSRSSFGGNPPILELLPAGIASGETRGSRPRVPFGTIPLDACTIGKLIRNSASGAWTVPGDFGVRMQN